MTKGIIKVVEAVVKVGGKQDKSSDVDKSNRRYSKIVVEVVKVGIAQNKISNVDKGDSRYSSC